MSDQELPEGVSIESYGGGWIIADYSGKRGEASYRGIAPTWSRQPIVSDPFQTKDAAVEVACKNE